MRTRMFVIAALPALLLLCALAPVVRADTPEEQLAAASALIDAKRWADAAAKLDVFVAKNPNHPKIGPAALALGQCRSQLKQYAQAIPAYEKAIASKEFSVVGPAQLGLGEAAMNAKQYEKAIKALEDATQGTLKPEQGPYAWYWLGQANYQLQRYAPAGAAYLHVIRDYPRSDLVDSALLGAGLAALKTGPNSAARAFFRTLIDRYPDSDERPQAMLVLAQMDTETNGLRQARSEFEAILDDPKAKARPDIQRAAQDGLVRVLLSQQDYAAAATRLEAIVAGLPETDPQRYRAQISLGHSRYHLKQYDTALAAYLDAAKSPEDAVASEGMYWAANDYLALDRPVDAAAQFTKFVARFPKSDLAAKAQLKAAESYLAAKQTDSASKAYRAVVERYPDSPQAADARKALAEVVDSISDPAQLAAALKTAAPADRARGTIRLAKLYLEQKRYADAIAPLSDLLKPKPDDATAAEAQYLLGIAYDAQEKSAPAAAALAEAVRIAPSAEWALDAQTRLAWLSLDLKQPASAEKAANAALALKPDKDQEQQIRMALVRAELDQQKWDDALQGCQTLLAANPAPDTVATVLYTQAWVNEKQGKTDQALPLWEKLANDFPKNDRAADALLHLGDARLKAEKYDEARDKYNALLTAFPNSKLVPEARFKLGSALYNGGHPDEAAAQFDALASDKSAGDYAPEGLYWSGVALDKAGKKDEAIDRLSKLVAQYPTHTRVANAKIRLAALKAVK